MAALIALCLLPLAAYLAAYPRRVRLEHWDAFTDSLRAMSNQERDHTGRFAFDDTARRWAKNILAFIGLLTILALLALAFGVYRLAT